MMYALQIRDLYRILEIYIKVEREVGGNHI